MDLSGGQKVKKFRPRGLLKSKPVIIVFAVLFAGVGAYLLIHSFAAKPTLNLKRVERLKEKQAFLSDEVLVKLKSTSKVRVKKQSKADDTGLTNVNRLNTKYRAKKFEPLVESNKNSTPNDPIYSWYKVKLDTPSKKVTNKDFEGDLLKGAISEYLRDPDIETAQPNFIMKASAVPNDPYFHSGGSWGQSYDDLWNLKKINLPQAWDITKGSSTVMVANIDTGVDRSHPELASNIWSNSNEIENNGKDDDGNGFIDDKYGWNFANNNKDTMDRNGHGTHVAGIIGATGNNGQGITGVNWSSKIMPVKVLDDQSNGNVTGAVNGIMYAINAGAKVLNLSIESEEGALNNPLNDAIKYANTKGVVSVVPAGNSQKEVRFTSPANADGAITVAASGLNDQAACFSNWGSKIDIIAPGGDYMCNRDHQQNSILSTRSSAASAFFPAIGSDNNFSIADGTSFSAPHVSGVAALILAKYPSATPEQIRQALRIGATDLGAAGQDIIHGFGRLDAAKTLAINPISMITPTITAPISGSTLPATGVDIIGTTAGTNFSKYDLEVAFLPYDGLSFERSANRNEEWTKLASSITPITNGKLGSITSSQFPDGTYSIRLTVTNTSGQIFRAQSYYLRIDNFKTKIVSPTYKIAQGINDINGIAQVIGSGLTFTNYKLEWGQGKEPSSWSTAGITVPNSSQQVVADASGLYGASLGSWDTSKLTDGQIYSLRLSVTASNGATERYATHYTVDKDLAPGWPKSICTDVTEAAVDNYSNFNEGFCGRKTKNNIPAMADITGDSTKEVIFYGYDDYIFAYNQDGTNVSGFPYKLPNNLRTNSFNSNGIVTSDMDGDGKDEIVFIVQGLDSATIGEETIKWGNTKHYIYVLKGNGVLLSGWVPPTYYMPSQDWSSFDTQLQSQTPSIADLNNDGKKEIIVVDRPDIATKFFNGVFTGNSRIHAYELNGRELTGFPVTFQHNSLPTYPSPVHASPVIADITADEKPEIIWGIGNQLFAFDGTGRTLSGWPYNIQGQFYSNASAVGDIDGDGQNEVIGVTRKNDDWSTRTYYALEADATVVPGWPKSIKDPSNYSTSVLEGPAVVDLDNDGKDDVLTTAWNQDNSTEVPKIFYGNGNGDTDFWDNMINNHVMGSGFGQSPIMQPIVFDYDSDGQLEILIQSRKGGAIHSETKAFHPGGFGLTNTLGDNLWSKQWTREQLDSGQSVAGVLTGRFNVASAVHVANDEQSNYYLSSGVFLWRLPSGVSMPTKEWPQYGSNAAHTSSIAKPDTKPPTAPVLTAIAGSHNKVDLSWTESSDESGIAAYLIVRNGFWIWSTTGATDYTDQTAQPNTTYQYQVAAVDSAGNVTLSNTVSVTTPKLPVPDTTKPTTPSGLKSTGVSSTQVNLSWKKSTDNVGIKDYDVLRNGKVIATVTTTSFGDVSVFASTKYSYSIRARDAAGNVSATSTAISVTTSKNSSRATLQGTTYYRKGTSPTLYRLAGTTINIPYKGSNHYYASSASSATLGAYKIVGIPPGNHSVIFSKTGYTTKTYNVSLTSGQTKTLNAALPKK